MELKGNAHKFGDDINTDLIISGKYKFKTLDMKELAKHVLEDARAGFYDEISKGDFIVAGKNFGCGSSREQAPLAIKHAGIGAVIAKSFARIFYRNAVNIGLPAVICNEADKIDEGDSIEVDLGGGRIIDHAKGIELKIQRMPEFMQNILDNGGLIEHFTKTGSFF